MKTAMYWIITIGTLLAGMLLVLALSPANACWEKEVVKPLPDPGPAPLRTKTA